MRPEVPPSDDDARLAGAPFYVCDHEGAHAAARRDVFEAVILPLFLLRPVECPDCRQRWYAFPRGFGPLIEPVRFRNGLAIIVLGLLLSLLAAYLLLHIPTGKVLGPPG